MKKWLPLFAAALWWGSLTAVGAWVVPLLFKHLATPSLAGQMAARLFEFQTHVGAACAVVVLMSIRANSRFNDLSWVVGGLLLALLQQWAVAPRIEARDNLALWHGLGSAMLVLQWLCAGVVLWLQARGLQAGTVNPDSSS
jgi:Domain of unknown function (DUF4149)